jgi:hypothetical protein
MEITGRNIASKNNLQSDFLEKIQRMNRKIKVSVRIWWIYMKKIIQIIISKAFKIFLKSIIVCEIDQNWFSFEKALKRFFNEFRIGSFCFDKNVKMNFVLDETLYCLV